MGLAILLGIFGAAVVLGVPVAFAMGVAAAATFWYEGFPLLITFQRSVSGISVFSLLAIPFFVFAGELMLHGGIAMRLVRFASALVGHVRGGLASVNIFSSMLFGGISGSAVADISALGSILIPVMKERGYHPDYAVNVTVTSSIAGIVIPPSHNMIIFAVAAGGGISISKLFLAGVIPGILMCVCLAVAAYIIAIKRNYPAEPFPGWAAVWSTSLQATTAMVMVLIGFASSFAYLLALYQVPDKLSGFMLGVSEEKIAVLLMINIMLLVLGMIMDMAALILICTPIFLPIVKDLGMDPTQFGIMLLVNLGLGLCTPPVGTCLFVGCAVGRIKIEETLRTIWPFYLAILAALVLVTYVPAVSLWLPSLFD